MNFFENGTVWEGPQQVCLDDFLDSEARHERTHHLDSSVVLRAPVVSRWQNRHRVGWDPTDGRNGGAEHTVWDFAGAWQVLRASQTSAVGSASDHHGHPPSIEVELACSCALRDALSEVMKMDPLLKPEVFVGR